MILWMLEDSDSGKDEIFPKERERIPLALAQEREQEKMEKMVEIIGTSEHTENSKSVLELRENRSPIQGLLGEPWQMATATESRTFKFSWKGK